MGNVTDCFEINIGWGTSSENNMNNSDSNNDNSAGNTSGVEEFSKIFVILCK